MSANTDFTGKFTVADNTVFDPKNIVGRSAVVTGGASGIGEVIVKQLVQNGAYVAFSDLSAARGEQLVNTLGGATKATFVPGNVNVWTDQVALFAAAATHSPSHQVDVVVANAGTAGNMVEPITNAHTGPDGAPREPDLTVLDTNLRAQQYTVSLALHAFAKLPPGEGRDGCLVLTASTAGYLDMQGAVQYQVSKFGMRAVMRSLRGVLPQYGARVNVIAPWWVRTPLINDGLAKRIDDSGMQWAEVEDCAAAVLHIVSDRQINGRALGIIPRSVHKRGYIDMQEDDHYTETRGTEWEKMIQSVTAKASGSQGARVLQMR